MSARRYNCTIIGAGASGLFTAARILLQRPGISVALIDSNPRCGKKLMLTGSGRCNFTNSDLKLSAYNTDDHQKLLRAFDRFGSSDAIDFFENVLGVLTTNKGNLYYPATLRAGTVVDALRYFVEEHGAHMINGCKIKELHKNDKGFELITEDGEKILSDKTVIATGGITYPKTGSEGDAKYLLTGLMSFKDFTEFKCSLVPLYPDDQSLKALAGVRIPATVSLIDGKEQTVSSGELQITKDGGLSGICIFDLSGRAVRAMDSGREPVIKINFCNAEPGECCLMAAVRAKMFPERSISAAFSGIIQRTVLDYVLKKTGYKCNMPAKDLSYDDLVKIADALTSFPVKITDYGKASDAQVSQGGVNLASLDDNMQVKKTKGLYVVGEAVNVDGICGGYNLQWAWTSASLCADGIIGDTGL